MRCKYLFRSHLFNHENYCNLQLAICITTACSVGINILLPVYNITNPNGFCTIVHV